MNKIDEILFEFGRYLEQRRLAPKSQIPFLKKWVHRFLIFARPHRKRPFEEVFALFGNFLAQNVLINDWQLRQALDAVRIYAYQFRQIHHSTHSLSPTAEEFLDLDTVMKRLREVFRLRHYSYQTEKTYSYWVKKFYRYCSKLDIDTAIGEEEVRSFLTHLALH